LNSGISNFTSGALNSGALNSGSFTSTFSTTGAGAGVTTGAETFSTRVDQTI
jgi:hypothetical protein